MFVVAILILVVVVMALAATEDKARQGWENLLQTLGFTLAIWVIVDRFF